MRDLPNAIKEKWATLFNGGHNLGKNSGHSSSDEYKQTQHERINEIKEEIKSRAGRFNIFRGDEKCRTDEKEFKDFMSNNPDSDK